MTLSLSQQRRELLYSIFVIVLIPAIVIANTLWLTSRVSNNFDLELHRRANLANEVFGVSASKALSTNAPGQSAVVIQALIDQTIPQTPEINLLSVTTKSGQVITTIASSDRTRIGKPISSKQAELAYERQSPIATLIAAGESQTRNWEVVNPIFSPTGQVLGATIMRVSLDSADKTMTSTLRDSFIILGVVLLGIVLLLLNHFRLVEYAELFRKQKELDQMKDDFISIATHELRAPMGIIKSYISMAIDEKDVKTAKEFLTTAFDQTERLNRLVSDLLSVSRLEQGRTTYKLTPLNLATIIDPLIANFQIKAKEKQLGLSYEQTADLPLVMADQDRLQEIMTNLIDNAIKYSKTGTVKVSHSVDQTSVTTTVADTGIGMTPEEQSRLFQRFYRARNADTQEIAGTGLGLWIIKQYAEGMGGTITVRSTKGKGSQFIVTLPRGANKPTATK